VLVRRHPNGKRGQHQVVLIDHGLYITLSETFRRQYAELWRAIFQLDIKKLEEITKAWGMGEGSAELFASATLMRPWKKPKSKEEQEREAEEKRKDSQHHINKQKEMIKGFLVHVEMVPKELIFVGRSMRIVQANNQVLHSPVNRINILARHAASALLTNDTPTLYRALIPRQNAQHTQLSSRLSLWFYSRMSFFTFRSTLFLLDIAFVGSSVLRVCHRSWLIVKNSVIHGPWSQQTYIAWKSKAGGFEDDLEHGMRQLAKEEFGVELDENAFMG
jgi:aarF domain-containing kinase